MVGAALAGSLAAPWLASGLGVRAFVVLLAGIAAVARTRPSAVLDAPTSGPPIPQQRRPVEPGQTLSASSGS